MRTKSHIGRRFDLLLATLVAYLIIPASTEAQSKSVGRYLIGLSKANHTLAIVDPASLKVITTVPVGPDPHEVIASADGKTAFVSNAGLFHRIDVIDLTAQKAIDTIDTSPLTGPHGLAFMQGKLWFASQGAKAVGRIDPASRKIDLCLGTGQNRTHMIWVSRDAKRVMTTNVISGTVSLFTYQQLQPTVTPTGAAPPDAKPYWDWVQTVIPFKPGNEGFAVSPDEKELWTATPVDGSIGVIDMKAQKLIDTIDAKALGANRMAFTPDGKMVLVASIRTGDLYFIDAHTRKEIKHINIGHGCAHILVDDTQPRAFVSCTADNYVAVIDLTALSMTAKIDIGGRPDGLAWSK